MFPATNPQETVVTASLVSSCAGEALGYGRTYRQRTPGKAIFFDPVCGFAKSISDRLVGDEWLVLPKLATIPPVDYRVQHFLSILSIKSKTWRYLANAAFSAYRAENREPPSIYAVFLGE
jgi:hypothetical protein